MNDFRFALRQLCKSPGFTSLAIMTLALGIGVNSAIFALVNGAVLRPMVPLRPAEVVNIFTARQNTNHDYRQFSHTEYRELRANGGDLFADFAALEFAVAGIGRDHEMRRSFVFLTSENFFSLMGVQPVRGRFYTAEECRPNANVPVVVASYAFWKRMGSRNDFVGSSLQINGQPYTVIGITPDGFSGVSALVAPDIWLPLGVHSHLGSAFADSETLHDLAEPKITRSISQRVCDRGSRLRQQRHVCRRSPSDSMLFSRLTLKAREIYSFTNRPDSVSAPHLKMMARSLLSARC
jgi:putative ABC transport system permease protein